jgi:tetratricopeptide (TPR) repeat protein
MAGNKEAFQKAMNQGHSAAWDQEWDQAANFYSAALDEFPDHSMALSSLGLAMYEMQDYETALTCYQRAAILTPEDPVPQEKIARIFERMGRLDEAVRASTQAAEMHLKARSADKAIDNWNRVLSLQPENIIVRSRLANVYERLGRKEEAVNEYIATSSILQHNGDLTRALKVTEHAQKLIPDNQEVRLALHMLRSNQFLPRPSRPRGGTAPVRMAVVRQLENASDESANTQADPIAEARQKALVDLAAQLFDQAEEPGTGSSTSTRRGINALTRGVGESPAVNNGSERTRIILHLGQAIDSQTQGDFDQAAVELEHAIGLGLHQPSAYFNLGMLVIEKDREKAQPFLQQSVKHPDYALASNLLMAKAYVQSEQWNEAATAYLQSLALADAQTVPADQADELMQMYEPILDSQSNNADNASFKHICQTIESQLIRPDWRQYLNKARQQLPIQPDGSPPLPIAEMVLEMRSTQVVETMAHVRSLAQEGKLHSAIEEAFYALQYAPTYMPLHLLLGELMLQDQRVQDAVHKFMVVADLYTVRNETSRAIRTLKRVTQLVPMDLNVRQRLIDLLIAHDKPEEALNESQELAGIYYRLAELDKARQTYLDALKIAQKSKNNRAWGVNLLLKVADIDLQRLNLRQALRIYEQIRTIQPDEPSVHAQLVMLNLRLGQEMAAIKELDEYLAFLESTGKRVQAIEFINDLLLDHGKRLDLRRRLADLYVRNNQVNEAVIQLDAVADSLLSENRNLEAINMMETIISIKPPNVEEYRLALENLRRDMLRK